MYTPKFLKHIANEVNCDVKELENAIESFSLTSDEPIVSSKKEKSKTKSAEKDHTCERIPRGKTDPCGKKAKNNADGHWYCGTEKSGCYKSILGALTRKTKADAAKPLATTTRGPKKKPTLKEKKKNADAKSQNLIDRVIKRKKLQLKKITVGGKVRWIEHNRRILIDRATNEAYGELSKKNKIVPLSDKNVRFLESSNISIRKDDSEETTGSKKKAALKKKIAKVIEEESSSDEEDDDDQESDEDDKESDDEVEIDSSDDEDDKESDEEDDKESDDEVEIDSSDDEDDDDQESEDESGESDGDELELSLSDDD